MFVFVSIPAKWWLSVIRNHMFVLAPLVLLLLLVSSP